MVANSVPFDWSNLNLASRKISTNRRPDVVWAVHLATRHSSGAERTSTRTAAPPPARSAPPKTPDKSSQ